MTVPLQFASLYDGQEVFVWSDCQLDFQTQFDRFGLKQSDRGYGELLDGGVRDTVTD